MFLSGMNLPIFSFLRDGTKKMSGNYIYTIHITKMDDTG